MADAAQIVKLRLVLAAAMFAVGACSATESPAVSGPGWIKVNETVGYGLPDSEFDLILGCQQDGVVFSSSNDASFQGSRPATITVDGISFAGRETSDPPDELIFSHIKVPIDHPAMRRLASSARRISFVFADGSGDTIPAGSLPAEFIGDCMARQRR